MSAFVTYMKNIGVSPIYDGPNSYSYTGGTAPNICLYAFNLPYSMTVSNIILSLPSSVTGTGDVGIYDTSGNLQVHAGLTTLIAGAPFTFAMTSPATLAAGTYLIATSAPDNGFYYLMSGLTASTGGTGSNMGYYQTSTSTDSTGVLPSTITLIAGVYITPQPASIQSVIGDLCFGLT
jgi:hypothetical protein